MTARAGAAAVVALALVRGVALLLLVPPLQAPDEDAHFDHVQYRAERRRPPPGGPACDTHSPEVEDLGRVVFPVAFHPERRLAPAASYAPAPDGPAARRSPGCGPASGYPPLPYVSAALAYRAVRGAPLVGRLQAARFVSVLWSCAGTLAAFLFGLWALGGAGGALLTGLVYATHPMIGLAAASVTPDSALLAATTAACAAVAALRAGARPALALAALALAGLWGALSKGAWLLAAPALGLATLALAPRRPRAWMPTAAALAPGFGLALAWELAGRGQGEAAAPSTGSVADLLVHMFAIGRLHRTYVTQVWMAYGWADTVLGRGWYRAATVALVAALVGLALGWRRLGPGEREAAVLGGVATCVLVLALHGLEVGYLRHTGQLLVQGRYLLVFAAPLTVAAAAGLRALGRRLRPGLDLAWALPVLVVLLQAATAVRLLERYYDPNLGRALEAARAWAALGGVDALRPALAALALGLAGAACLSLVRTFRPGRGA